MNQVQDEVSIPNIPTRKCLQLKVSFSEFHDVINKVLLQMQEYIQQNIQQYVQLHYFTRESE